VIGVFSCPFMGLTFSDVTKENYIDLDLSYTLKVDIVKEHLHIVAHRFRYCHQTLSSDPYMQCLVLIACMYFMH
jgi:hypothetical protein